MGNLRQDLDDSEYYAPPVVGGRWTEKGYLGGDPERSYGERFTPVGHAERAPASIRYDGGPGESGWVTPANDDANRRDLNRGRPDQIEESQVSYADTPSVPPPIKRVYRNGQRATRADFVDEAENEGSLWASNGQTNYFFTKNKVRGIGDIVTVSVEVDLVRDAVAEVTRTLNPRERELELRLAQERLKAKVLGLEDPDAKASGTDTAVAAAAGPNRSPAAGAAAKKEKTDSTASDEDIVIPKATATDIDVGKSLQLKAGETVMAEIVDRYENGNYKLRGVKKVPYRNGFRMLSLVGVARGTDITEEDTVNSGKLYEYRLEVLR